MTNCNAKIIIAGVKDDCPCVRYIPDPNWISGPLLCRDCLHFESAHPGPVVNSKGSLVNALIDKVKLQREQGGQAEGPAKVKVKVEVTDEEARRETNAGFRPREKAEDLLDVDGSSKKGGHGSGTRFKVSKR